MTSPEKIAAPFDAWTVVPSVLVRVTVPASFSTVPIDDAPDPCATVESCANCPGAKGPASLTAREPSITERPLSVVRSGALPKVK